MKSSKKIFGKNAKYIRHIHLAGKRNRDDDDKIKCLNEEIRDREKVFKGLKRLDTLLIDGLKAYHNFTKKHSSLKDKTSAEQATIEIDDKNKWITLIQNASLHRENSASHLSTTQQNRN